jgi:hypothetical protein
MNANCSFSSAGQLLDQKIEGVREATAGYASTHVIVYQHFTPIMKDEPSSSYTMISGFLGVTLTEVLAS